MAAVYVGIGHDNDLAIASLGQIEVLGHPVTLSRTPGGVRTPTPEKGEHSEEILKELGVSLEEIEQLRREKVI